MARNSLNKILIKIVFWGIKGTNKNTPLDILYNITKDKETKGVEMSFTEELTRIPTDVEGLFFDRGVFQSTKMTNLFFHVYNMMGDPNFGNQMSRLFLATDGIVFVFNGQQSRWNENVESLSLLKKIVGPKLLEKIPMTVILTKENLPDAINQVQVEQLLKTEGLLWAPGEIRGMWNPMIFEANLQDPTSNEVYKAFAECVRRVGMYKVHGGGSAPTSEKTSRINLIIPETLKSEWEQFSSEVVHASMSQMIRDAVREYMKKMKQSSPQPESLPEDQKGQTLEKMIERIVAKKLDAMLKNQ